MRARTPLLLLLAAALTSASALGQPAPEAPPPPPLQTTPIAIPPPPDVNDPMLAPMPPAPRSIATLDEALSLVKSRSTDLRIAQLEVERAAAQSRIALAGLLPTINGSVSATHQLITTDSQIIIGANGQTPITRTLSTPTPNSLNGGAQIVQPLINVRNWHSWGTAREFEKAQQLSLEDVQRNLALGLANALVAVVTAERVAELNRVGFRNALERLDLTRRGAPSAPRPGSTSCARNRTSRPRAPRSSPATSRSFRRARRSGSRSASPSRSASRRI